MRPFYTSLLILIFSYVGCRREDIAAEFYEIKENIARFDLTNNTSRAVRWMSMELTYLSVGGEAILVDTVSYSMADTLTAFLEAAGETFIVQSVPPGSVSAEARVLEVTYMDGAE